MVRRVHPKSSVEGFHCGRASILCRGAVCGIQKLHGAPPDFGRRPIAGPAQYDIDQVEARKVGGIPQGLLILLIGCLRFRRQVFFRAVLEVNPASALVVGKLDPAPLAKDLDVQSSPSAFQDARVLPNGEVQRGRLAVRCKRRQPVCLCGPTVRHRGFRHMSRARSFC